MSDLISRNKLYEYALNQKDKAVTPNDIMRFPSAESRKAKWEFVGLQMFVCSECKHGFRQDWLMDWRTHNNEPIFPNFCSNCGADMRVERRSE